MEIEKMMKIRERLVEEVDKENFDQALKFVNDTFKKMISSTTEKIKDVSYKSGPDLAKAEESLNVISELAKKSGIDFPFFDTIEKVKIYILKYGMEIVRS